MDLSYLVFKSLGLEVAILANVGSHLECDAVTSVCFSTELCVLIRP